MTTIRNLVLSLATLALALTACKPNTTISSIQIDSVEVEITGRAVSAHVSGVVGDSCTTSLPPEIKRESDTVSVTINGERKTDAACAQLAQLYDEVILLGTDFAPGNYTVTVNGVEAFFSVGE